MASTEFTTASLRGTTTFFDGTFNAESVTVIICCALAMYNALVLLTLIFVTFRRFRGLYFWSLLAASFGIIPYDLGFIIEYFQLTAQVAGLVVTAVGWPMLVTGQSLVLYSRLGVLMAKEHRNLLKAVKWMIIVDGVVLHTSTLVVNFGAYCAHPAREFQLAYRYIEKIQMTVFTIQELIISGLYVWRTIEILKVSNRDRRRTRRVMWQLFSINVIIIVLDVALLVVEYQNRHVIEQALKEVVYSVKLKFEFAILSKLAGLTQQGNSESLGAFETYDDTISEHRQGSLDAGRSRSQTWMCSDGLQPDLKKRGAMQHIERSPSVLTGKGTDMAEHDSIIQDVQPAYTADQQRRRRTLEDDLYAGVCKDLAG
ncbi:hypothetical protein LTR91_011779 [Friedmanniomyces endolithicus]|uniref:DUF7703 domain-containing protein n=1 Tax=Friedmanniomyces endolithicus TaxID=329885 RepID=A0AAN6KGQ4_9PEZI|nr:hypothetical protein LTR94_002537 [Friedmanniomyces endolithicus]KAK0801413.1 hypothetical protein LTR59_005446 [Friedmanniomyces endolithicus]KAK0807171.1 hypothetical protein LTR38_005001 [Friedmanniomyces endolithicus]KAK0821176.1 hypothetical protein LTR75_000977 [Friedmanniomyces endolithicus]KAK0841338.1 hypothetical protein LTR03_009998 [Friedmanniomyces endolithicus]